jgi:hypothetical protein
MGFVLSDPLRTFGFSSAVNRTKNEQQPRRNAAACAEGAEQTQIKSSILATPVEVIWQVCYLSVPK